MFRRSTWAVAGALVLISCSSGPRGAHDANLFPLLHLERAGQLTPEALTLRSPVLEAVAQDWSGAPGGAEELSRNVLLLKKIDLSSSGVRADDIERAFLEIHLYEAAANRTPLVVAVNGAGLVELQPDPSRQGRYEWRSVEVPVQWLGDGVNRFVLRAAANGRSSWAVPIRRHVLPNHSARSGDAGVTWNFDELSDGRENGEYEIRLRLTSRAVARASTSIVALAPGSITPRLEWEGEARSGATVRVLARTGPVAILDTSWSRWHELDVPPETPARVEPRPGDRYLQVGVELAAGEGEAPVVRGLLLHDAATPGSGSLDAVNRWAQFGAQFGYQPPADPQLADLRSREKLDAVVGAGDELTQVVRLRDWVRRQFPDGNPDPYPPARADVILDWIRSGRTEGFCGQHAFVFGQALMAFGFQVRYVELGMNTPVVQGRALFPAVHFAVEYWSPTYAKWVFMDPNKNMHALLDDVPMSAREIHHLSVTAFDSMLQQLRVPAPPPAAALSPVWRQERQLAPDLRVHVSGWTIGATRFEVVEGPTPAGARLDYFYYLRILLRNNHLIAPSPNVDDLLHSSGTRGDHTTEGWNAMLEYEDPAVLPLGQPIAKFSTSDPATFDWRLDLVDLDIRQSGPAIAVRAATSWPHPGRFRLRAPDLSAESADGSFALPATIAGFEVSVEDSAGRAVACARAAALEDAWDVGACGRR